ncbi:Uncharacterised protein [Salmonella enterica subsp. enterica serovar Typhimurium str. DT104]|nr:hypothetical protein SE18cs_00306 [Salmonella enterica subsp. enterica serovar Typhimurium]CFB82013.1 Uncharacterised protein [Salmonella enterica subsp. enterica serovar Typhimurium str. DT104]GAR61059.1 hypothetical protein NGUA15_02842 [Salmonella enterica]AML93372.1 hypothetical protein SE17cs_00307 [Salmonella enterica subsp. enterica serovar Typhimurium]AML98062.1 hypothetical protein SE16cs_00301 [Salmonella enterica subsp. enterica serovar Typhimurium]
MRMLWAIISNITSISSSGTSFSCGLPTNMWFIMPCCHIHICMRCIISNFSPIWTFKLNNSTSFGIDFRESDILRVCHTRIFKSGSPCRIKIRLMLQDSKS